MNIKKFLLHIMLLTIGMLTIASCSDDKDNDLNSGNSIVGTWRCDYEDGYDLITFEKDGTLSLIVIDNVYGNWSDFGYYSYYGNIIVFDWGDDGGIATVISLTENKLILVFGDDDDYDDDDYEITVWTRVK